MVQFRVKARTCITQKPGELHEAIQKDSLFISELEGLEHRLFHPLKTLFFEILWVEKVGRLNQLSNRQHGDFYNFSELRKTVPGFQLYNNNNKRLCLSQSKTSHLQTATQFRLLIGHHSISQAYIICLSRKKKLSLFDQQKTMISTNVIIFIHPSIHLKEQRSDVEGCAW